MTIFILLICVIVYASHPNSEKACWDINDLNLLLNNIPRDLHATELMRVVAICREKWEYASGHVLARDIVIIEKIISV